MIFFRRKDTSSQPQDAQVELSLGSKLRSFFKVGVKIDASARENLEELLLLSDINVSTTTFILQLLEERLKSNSDPIVVLNEILVEILRPIEKQLIPDSNVPWVVLLVGSNGVGKTTTIAKLAHWYIRQGHKPLLAAGDTFRAAAVEQLQIWAKRLDIPIVAQHGGADSAAVIFDAIESARSKGNTMVLADTAGRMHNKEHLLEELAKIKRVAQRACPGAPHETLLIVDATTGQNATVMTDMFHNTIGLSGLIISKLDGTAKGGSVFTLAHKYGLPIPFVGVGESIEDLHQFNAKGYVTELLR